MLAADPVVVDPRLGQYQFFEPDAYHWTAEHWIGMPPMHQPDVRPLFRVVVHFRTSEDRAAFAEVIAVPLTSRTRAIWWPPEPNADIAREQIVDDD